MEKSQGQGSVDLIHHTDFSYTSTYHPWEQPVVYIKTYEFKLVNPNPSKAKVKTSDKTTHFRKF